MFYLRWVFILNIFIFPFSSSALEVEDFESPGHLEQKEFEVSHVQFTKVVRLLLKNGKGMGTGFFISPDRLATANHVIEDGPLHFKDDLTGNSVFTKVLVINKSHDLAILQTVNYKSNHFFLFKSKNEEAVDSPKEVLNKQSRVYSHETKKGDLVYIPGFPRGIFNVFIGNITEFKQGFSTIVMITHKIKQMSPPFGGISGAPVFSKENNLIGVTITGTRYPSLFNLIGFIPIEKLKDLVRTLENGNIPGPKENENIREIILFLLNRQYKQTINFNNLQDNAQNSRR